MGVKTKVFGRYAWLVFEGMGKLYDDYMAQTTDPVLKSNMQNYMAEFMFSIGTVLPCVYCRRSYQTFTHPDHPEIDIYRFLSQANGGKRLIWTLHNRVNTKLRNQELRKATTRQEQNQVREKWRKYMISYEVAVLHRYPAVTSKRFWYAVVAFLALIMCDYRAEYGCRIQRFFVLMGKILCLSADPKVNVMARTYAHALGKTKQSWAPSMDLPTRIDIVWTIQRYVFEVRGWKMLHTRQEFESKCTQAIVGCKI